MIPNTEKLKGFKSMKEYEAHLKKQNGEDSNCGVKKLCWNSTII